MTRVPGSATGPPRRWHARLAVLVVLIGVLSTACVDAPRATPGDVRILASWTGQERAAFETVLAEFEDRTGVRVDYSSTRDLEGVLERGLEGDSPPDIAGLAGPAHMRELAASGALRNLTGVIDIGRYRQRVAPTFIDFGTVDTRLVGVFVRTSLKGLIWYNPAVFRLGTPTTWDELQRMATQAAPEAEAEWCVGLASRESSGWPGTDLVEQFLLRTAGPGTYDAWASGDLEWTSREVRRAFELYGQVVAEAAVHGGVETALRTDFGDAGDPLFDDPPGCLFLHQGSFMPAFFAPHGWQPGTDYDFVPFPRLERQEEAVIGGGDLFGLLSDNPAAADLMRFLVSDEGQRTWVGQGGTLSVDATVVEYPDEISARAARLLSAAELFRFDASDLMPPELTAAFHTAILDTTADPSRLDAVLEDVEAVRRTVYGR